MPDGLSYLLNPVDAGLIPYTALKDGSVDLYDIALLNDHLAVKADMDLQNDRGEPVISGIPLVTGADLLAQYACMGLGFKLVVVCDDNTQDYPSKTDLGGRSHLLVSTE
ncbi:TPA: hypothetical protein JZG19_000082 [Escherichia coli]|nr:hypothetical protein [Escherichia coli]